MKTRRKEDENREAEREKKTKKKKEKRRRIEGCGEVKVGSRERREGR